jgi:hypothetical protein
MPFGLDTRTVVLTALFLLVVLPFLMRQIASRKK